MVIRISDNYETGLIIKMDDLLLKKELLNIDLLFGQLWEISVDGMRLIDEMAKYY